MTIYDLVDLSKERNVWQAIIFYFILLVLTIATVYMFDLVSVDEAGNIETNVLFDIIIGMIPAMLALVMLWRKNRKTILLIFGTLVAGVLSYFFGLGIGLIPVALGSMLKINVGNPRIKPIQPEDL